MSTLQDVRLQLRLIGYQGPMLNRGEVRELPALLHDGERIEQAIYGSYEKGYGMLVATDERLLFVDKRFFHRHIYEVSYEDIGGVEYETGLIKGTITLYARGSELILRSVPNGRIREFTDLIEQKTATLKTVGSSESSSILQ